MPEATNIPVEYEKFRPEYLIQRIKAGDEVAEAELLRRVPRRIQEPYGYIHDYGSRREVYRAQDKPPQTGGGFALFPVYAGPWPLAPYEREALAELLAQVEAWETTCGDNRMEEVGLQATASFMRNTFRVAKRIREGIGPVIDDRYPIALEVRKMDSSHSLFPWLATVVDNAPDPALPQGFIFQHARQIAGGKVAVLRPALARGECERAFIEVWPRGALDLFERPG